MSAMTTLVEKTFRNLLTLISSAFIASCATTGPAPIRTEAYVDLERFSGEWFIIASIPTFLEKTAYNAVETYDLPVDGVVKTTFRFNEGSLDGPVKEYNPKGYVREGTGNAVWGMQFVWPVKAEYRVMHLGKNYEVSIVGRTKRDFLWIMARQPIIDESVYARLLNIAEQEGYDLSRIRKVPHRVPE
jgi:apolipoprotein D and lipocalin family protein